MTNDLTIEWEQASPTLATRSVSSRDPAQFVRWPRMQRAFLNVFVLILLLMITVFQPPHACAYNIDLPSYVRHQREPNSMFGFSIAFHRGRAGYSNTNS